jgi:hypothetical protein
MTVDVPFPMRPPTPFWDPKGPMGGSLRGIGDTATGIVDAATAGLVAADRALNLQSGGYCPAGTVFNPQFGACQQMATLTVGGNSGMLILIAIGAVIFFMSRR